jgi:hypothetical protein
VSGPDRRDTRHQGGFVGGSDPEFGGDEEYTVQIVGRRRAFHVRCDVRQPFSAAEGQPRRYFVVAEVVQDFKGGEGQWGNLLGSAGTLHTDLDAADELFEDDE